MKIENQKFVFENYLELARVQAELQSLVSRLSAMVSSEQTFNLENIYQIYFALGNFCEEQGEVISKEHDKLLDIGWHETERRIKAEKAN